MGEGQTLAEARSPVCGQDAPLEPPHCQQQMGSGKTVLVIGALSFLGSRLAAHLAGVGWEVTGVSQDGDITSEGLVWYRKEQLETSGVEVKLLDFLNETQVTQLLVVVNPSQVVYIPPGLDSWEGYSPDNAVWYQYLTGFVVLLETLRGRSSCIRVLLASRSKHSSVTSHTTWHDYHKTVLGAWMESFELTLTAYHHLYHFPVTVLRTNGLYGPWSNATLSMLTTPLTDPMDLGNTLHLCWYIGDVVKAFQSALELGMYCEVLDLGPCSVFAQSTGNQLPPSLDENYKHSWELMKVSTPQTLAQGVRKSLIWAKSYTQHHHSGRDVWRMGGDDDVIFTSYFTTSEDSQRSRKKSPDRFRYMMNWFVGLKQLNLQAVVFHDGLDSKFRHRVRQLYPQLFFQLVPSLANRSTNDARFYAYLKYLDDHPGISRVLLTDISDVRFQMNPFDLMSLLGNDWLYVGTDIDIFPSMRTMPWIQQRLQGCFGNYSVAAGDLSPLMGLDTVYNAGVIGGSREMMMAALHRVVGLLDSTPPQMNCNMPAVNFAVHMYFFDRVFTGFPLTSRFLRRQTAPKGVFIVHK